MFLNEADTDKSCPERKYQKQNDWYDVGFFLVMNMKMFP
jgi:hypothetical protein